MRPRGANVSRGIDMIAPQIYHTPPPPSSSSPAATRSPALSSTSPPLFNAPQAPAHSPPVKPQLGLSPEGSALRVTVPLRPGADSAAVVREVTAALHALARGSASCHQRQKVGGRSRFGARVFCSRMLLHQKHDPIRALNQPTNQPTTGLHLWRHVCQPLGGHPHPGGRQRAAHAAGRGVCPPLRPDAAGLVSIYQHQLHRRRQHPRQHQQ